MGAGKTYKPNYIQSNSSSSSTDSGIQLNTKPKISSNGTVQKRKMSSNSSTSTASSNLGPVDSPKIPKLVLKLPKAKGDVISIKEITGHDPYKKHFNGENRVSSKKKKYRTKKYTDNHHRN
jgi:hypothetical protein